MSNTTIRPAAPPLPLTLAELKADRKVPFERTLNDYVEEVYLALYEQEKFNRLLRAVYDEQAVEGSLSADNIEAARMIRLYAEDNKVDALREEKLATISKALGTVLRRYGKSRKERRNMLGGEVVPGDASD